MERTHKSFCLHIYFWQSYYKSFQRHLLLICDKACLDKNICYFAKGIMRANMKKKKKLFLLLLYVSLRVHAEPEIFSYPKGNNIDETLMCLTNEDSKKRHYFCLHEGNAQQLAHWGLGKHTSFFRHTIPHGDNIVTPLFSVKKPLYWYVLNSQTLA